MAFSALPQKDAIDAKQKAKDEKNRKRERRQRQLEADRKWQENADLRASRLAQLGALEAPNTSAPLRIPDGPAHDTCDVSPSAAPVGSLEVAEVDGVQNDDSAEYSRQQACYICKARFSERHKFYSHLCPACASLNFVKRNQSQDLSGRVCLVTGARMKIGFQTALKLLRMGARVIATTRFPQDALKRYASEADSSDWLLRLEVKGIDFRFLGAVEEFCEGLLREEAHLDVLINNACQTIRRPAAYYRHLLAVEEPQLQAAITAGGSAATEARAVTEDLATQAAPGMDESAMMSQLQVLAEDRMPEEDVVACLPQGQRDAHGQQLDLRSSNSWLLKLGEVSTPEAVEVFCINTLTPFVLNGRLRPLLERSPHPDRYIVNVSAMEGKFYRYKQPTHPHTNMAKAALNMMTRTSAEDYARKSGIFMNSVDTGWINDENPLPTAQRIAQQHGFQTPIDEIDAAARILDPVLEGMRCITSTGTRSEAAPHRKRGGGGGKGGGGGQDEPLWGQFLKDFEATEW